jgi:hypothetical protein
MMWPVPRLAGHKLRADWRGWAALAVLIAIAGGAVLTAAAGAIRTATAYPRFLAAARASDVIVSPAGSGLGGYYDSLARLPGAAAVAPLAGLQAVPVVAGQMDFNGSIVDVATDGRYGRQVDVPRMLAGRLPSPGSPGEVAIDQVAAQTWGLHVGSPLPLAAFASQSRIIHTKNHQYLPARMIPARVVGVFVTRGSVVPVTYLDRVPLILASAAAFRQLGPGYLEFDGAYVRLRAGTSTAAFGAAAQELATRYVRATGGQVFVADEATQVAAVQRSIRPQAVALALFAAVLALSALLIVGQAAVRQVAVAARDNPTLAALGMTRRQLFAASLAETTVVTAIGALGAVAIAIVASPLTPIGPARLAEPAPGVDVNLPVFGIGVAAILVLFTARLAVTAWRRASGRPGALAARGEPQGNRVRTAERLARGGAPLPVVTGIRFALDPGLSRGAAASVRGAVLGLALAVAAAAGAVTFGANLLRLTDTPRLYGQDWNVAMDLQFATFTPKQFRQLTEGVPGIANVTFGVHGTVGVGATVIPAIGLAPGRGAPSSSTILTGRPPRASDEIVLGAAVLRQAGLRVGQRALIRVGGTPRVLTIVGSAVFPYFGEGSFTPTDVGEGAETTASLLLPQASAGSTGAGYNFALVRFAPGADVAASTAAFRRALATFCDSVEESTCVVTAQRPNTVNNYAAIDATPAVLAAILAVLGLGVLAQFIVSSGRRHRRDYAVLKVLGMFRRDLSAIAFCEVAAVAAVALAVGVPLGLAGGRWAWQLFADQAGLPPDTITPLPVLWMIPATLLIAALVALPPARSVARVPAAATLRSELSRTAAAVSQAQPHSRTRAPPHSLRGRLARGYSVRSTAAGRRRAAVQPGQAAMRFAISNVTGMASSTAASGTVAPAGAPAAPAK